MKIDKVCGIELEKLVGKAMGHRVVIRNGKLFRLELIDWYGVEEFPYSPRQDIAQIIESYEIDVKWDSVDKMWVGTIGKLTSSGDTLSDAVLRVVAMLGRK